MSQRYDGAANMPGKVKGVAARILQVQPLAFYTHCSTHQLNLVIISSCDIKLVHKMFTLLKVKIYFVKSKIELFFLYWLYFLAECNQLFSWKCLAANYISSKSKGRSSISLFKTPLWNPLVRSIQFPESFLNSIDCVYASLESIEDDTNETTQETIEISDTIESHKVMCNKQIIKLKASSAAGVILASLSNFEFLVSIFLVKDTLMYTQSLSALLRKVNIDLYEALQEIKNTVEVFIYLCIHTSRVEKKIIYKKNWEWSYIKNPKGTRR